MEEIIKKIEVVYAIPERQSTCVLCGDTFWLGTDIDDEGEIIVSPCKCYACDDSTYIADEEDLDELEI